MTDYERWYRMCLIQLGLDHCPPSADIEATKDTLYWFAKDPEWLRYAVQVARAHGDLKTSQHLLQPNEIAITAAMQTAARTQGAQEGQTGLHLSQLNECILLSDDGFVGDCASVTEVEIPRLPLDEKHIHIEIDAPLPDWFIYFFNFADTRRRCNTSAYIQFKRLEGDIGWLPPDATPNGVLQILTTSHGLSLGEHKNSKQRRKLFLCVIQHWLNNGRVTDRVQREIYSELRLGMTGIAISNAISALRKAMKKARVLQ